MSVKSITYVLTERCNYRCVMCPYGYLENPTSEISFQDIKNIFLLNPELEGLDSIYLTGGEVFLRSDIVAIVLFLIEHKIHVNITTNASMLDKIAQLCKDVKRLKYENALSITVSIDGLYDTHDRIRKAPGAFAKAMEAIALFRESGIAVGVNTVMQPDNLSELDEILLFFKEKSIPQKPTPWYMWTGDDFPYTENQAQIVTPYLSRWFDKKYILSRGRFRIQKNCMAGRNSFVIGPSGNVYACLTGYGCLGRKEEYLLGNLMQDNLTNILSSEQAHRTLSDTVKNCSGCLNGCEIMHETALDGTMDDTCIDKMKPWLSSESGLDYLSCELMEFHELESCSEGTFRWMSQDNAHIFLKRNLAQKVNGMMISYINGTIDKEPMPCAVYINQVLSAVFTAEPGFHTIQVEFTKNVKELFCEEECIAKVCIKCGELFSPAEFGSPDTRILGLGICSVKLIL